MKSFFKKLAFVMALAMVVSMAAPAAPVAYAAGELLFAYQDATSKDDYITSLEVKVGEEVDLKFHNGENWKGNIKLVSSDPSILEVTDNDYLKVKGVADGRTTLTLTILDQYVSMPVTVGNPAPEYIVEHKTSSTVEVVFAGAHDYKTSDVTLYRIYEGATGDIRVNWPIESVTATEKGFEVKPFVTFQNEDKYIITIGDEDVKNGEGYPFDIELGLPNELVVNYSCLGAKGKAYAKQDEEALPVKLSVAYFYNGIDVTEEYKDYEVSYEIISQSSDEVNLEEDELFFDNVNDTAVVSATATLEDAYGEDYVVTGTTAKIKATKATPYKVVGVTNWTIVKDETPAKDLVWDVHSIPANDDSRDPYKIVAILLDNRGNYILSSSEEEGYQNYLPASVAATVKAGKAAVYCEDSDEDYRFLDDELDIQFSSANVYKMLVGTEGMLTTYTEATVPAIVSIVSSGDDGEIVKNVSALEVKVTPERKVSSIVAIHNNAPITKLTLAANVKEDQETTYRQEGVTFVIYDQYGDKWYKEDVKINVTAKDGRAHLGINEGNPLKYNTTDDQGEKLGKFAYVVLDGKLITDAFKKAMTKISSEMKFTFTVAGTSVSTELKISFRKPTITASSEVTLSVKANTPVDLYMSDSYKTSGGNEFAYQTVKITLSEIIKSTAVGAVGFDGTVPVLYYDGVNYYGVNKSSEFLGTANSQGDITLATKGCYIVSVTDPNGRILPAVSEYKDTALEQFLGHTPYVSKDKRTTERAFDMVKEANNNERLAAGVVNAGKGIFEVVVAHPYTLGASDNVMMYAPTGEYKVNVYKFEEFVKGDNEYNYWVGDTAWADGVPTDLPADDATSTTDWVWNEVDSKLKNNVTFSHEEEEDIKFIVENSNPTVTFAYQDADVCLEEDGETVVDDICEIIKSCLKFNIDGEEWNYEIDGSSENPIARVEGRWNETAGYIIITDIYFKVPFNQTDDKRDELDSFGYLQKIKVNKSIRVSDNFDGFNEDDNSFDVTHIEG